MVKAGYKQTEVGEIPEDWDVVSLAQVGNPIIGLTYSPSNVRPHGTLVLRSSNVQDGRLSFDDNVYVEMDVPKRTLVKPGDVLICVRNGSRDLIGKCALIDKRAEGMAFGAFMSVFRSNTGEYVFWAFQSDIIKRQIVEHLGATINQITNKSLSSFRIPIPQRKEEIDEIVRALSDVDALIGSLEKLIAKKRDMKTATMQQLLTGKRRLPGFKKRWQHTEIRSHIDLLTGFPFPSPGYVSSGVRLLRGSNIKRGQLDWSEDLIKFWPKVDGEVAKYSLKEGDIVIAMDGSLVGRSFGQISKSDLPALLLQRVARVRSSSIDQGFLKEWICSPLFTEHCDNVKTVTAIPHISPEDILKFEIDVPEDLAEQKAIASFLADASSELRSLEKRLSKTKAIKQGMMQELLTGRTRLV